MARPPPNSDELGDRHSVSFGLASCVWLTPIPALAFLAAIAVCQISLDETIADPGFRFLSDGTLVIMLPVILRPL